MTTTVSPWTVDATTALTNRNLLQTATKPNSEIDMNGFLRLLTAQMQHQDPFQPLDNNQMVAQMASFSSLSAQTQSNSLLRDIADSLGGARLSDAASWIGKAMLVESNIATPDRSGAYAGELSFGSDTSGVRVDLVDGTGAIVQTIDLGDQKAGPVGFFWDGTNEAGEQIAGGPLQISVRGAAPTQVATWASIAAVQSPAGGTNAQLITALGNFTPDKAIRLG